MGEVESGEEEKQAGTLVAAIAATSKAREGIGTMHGIRMLIMLVVLATTRIALAAPVTVTFQINDSYVKGKAIANVSIGVATVENGPFVTSGTTDAKGQLGLTLEPGDYFVTYSAPSYVPVEQSPIHVGSVPMTITTTLTMMMEATGRGSHARIQIVLNWGSRTEDQVRDVDAHLLCPCGAKGAHVYYGALLHDGDGHSAALDVDDRDWGGPETITVTEPVQGSYSYWVYDYSGSGNAKLGMSDVVVRVVINDRVAGEYRMPTDVVERAWRPFRELAVEPSKEPRIVPFSTEDLTARVDRRLPPEQEWPSGSSPTEGTSPPELGGKTGWVFGLVVLLALVMFMMVRRRRRQSR